MYTYIQMKEFIYQVLGQLQIATELDALNVESMIILHENIQLG